MSLRESPTLTPALLAALRSNARKSTGPRTAAGKAHSRLNALKRGGRCERAEQFYGLLLGDPTNGLIARRFLTPEELAQPYYAQLLRDFPRWMAPKPCEETPAQLRRALKILDERSRNVI